MTITLEPDLEVVVESPVLTTLLALPPAQAVTLEPPALPSIAPPPLPAPGVLVPLVGPPGTPGAQGAPGEAGNGDDVPDLSVFFENGLI